MKKYLFIGLITLAPIFASAQTCYQVSAIENAWSRTTETLCVDQKTPDSTAEITLKTGLLFEEKIIAVFSFDLLERARCLDCNKDVFGLLNPSNSSFNTLSVHFDGVRDIQSMKEDGVVYIGATKLFYRSL